MEMIVGPKQYGVWSSLVLSLYNVVFLDKTSFWSLEILLFSVKVINWLTEKWTDSLLDNENYQYLQT